MCATASMQCECEGDGRRDSHRIVTMLTYDEKYVHIHFDLQQHIHGLTTTCGSIRSAHTHRHVVSVNQY